MPVDSSKVKAVVSDCLPRLLDVMGLKDQRIACFYERCVDPSHIASHSANLPYKKHAVTIDPLEHADEEDVADTLRHELIHVLLSEMEIPWRVIHTGPLGSSPDFKVFEMAWTLATERTVLAVERLCDNLGLTAKSLLEPAVGKRPDEPRAIEEAGRAAASGVEGASDHLVVPPGQP